MTKEPTAFIEIKGLTKTFGDVAAIKGISLSLSNGTYGLIGPNGAGKTTLMKLVLGLIRPTKGKISILGNPPGSPEANAAIGYLSENMGYYDDLSAVDYLQYFAHLFAVPDEKAAKRIATLLKKMELDERKDDPISTYSKGMRQRLGVARAMLHRPEVYILDEPLSGLDPTGRKDVLKALTVLKQQGKTVLISSHELKDMDMICDHICVMKEGRILVQGTPKELMSEDNLSRETLAFNIHTPSEIINELPKAVPEILEFKYEGEDLTIVIKHDPTTERKILSWLLEKKIDFSQKKHVIDSIYTQLFQEGK